MLNLRVLETMTIKRKAFNRADQVMIVLLEVSNGYNESWHVDQYIFIQVYKAAQCIVES